MDTEPNRVIATCGPTAQTTQVHHRDFPEIRADGPGAKEAASLLVNKLSLALDTALTDWRRQALSRAVADVADFLKSGG